MLPVTRGRFDLGQDQLRAFFLGIELGQPVGTAVSEGFRVYGWEQDKW